MAREIPLTRGLVAIVDDEDFDWLNQWKWFASTSRQDIRHAYASRHVWEQGRQIHLRMHRLILAAKPGVFVDHVDRNTLNNRRANLRLATTLQNNVNRAGTGKHPYKGIGFVAECRSRPWFAYVRDGGRRRRVGWYAKAEEAALAYDRAARALYGEFAYLNFPEVNHAN